MLFVAVRNWLFRAFQRGLLGESSHGTKKQCGYGNEGCGCRPHRAGLVFRIICDLSVWVSAIPSPETRERVDSPRLSWAGRPTRGMARRSTKGADPDRE